ncbi:CAP domain-containing protein [Streptomyces cellostaticus]|uniref:CAP domain-containing protein n=1 Tax=Streptomyces cellostaticus TaxID=67285 RepID=UPI0020268D73|nr:CAP domain-containing protein [Streptomyces cellostaticus]
MGEHRKKQQYRRVVVAAVAVSAVGVPSIAMACAEWPDGSADRSVAVQDAAQSRYAEYGQRYWHGDGGIAPSWLPTQIPSAAAPSTPAGTPPKPKPKHKHRHAHKHTVKVSPSPSSPTAGTPQRAPKPAATASPATPRPTATAPTASAPATTAPATDAPSTPEPTATASGVTARIVELVNAERGKAGCSPLTLNATLTKAAQEHSEDMAAHQNMSHTGSDGSSPGDRITAAGYTWSSYGENVAYGYATAEQVMDGWMSSPGHRANILNCSFKEIGVGLAQPNSYWTQDFGTAR